MNDGRTLVDSNVILDVLTNDPVWSGWSGAALAAAADAGPVVINPIVYAEVSVGFDRVEDLDAALSPEDFTRDERRYRTSFPGLRLISPSSA